MSQSATSKNGILLEIQDLQTHFVTDAGTVRAVDGVSLTVRKGETLGVVGESGCGKSVTATVLRLIPNPPGKIMGGKILLGGRNLLDLPEDEMRKVRGGSISMIFQEPTMLLGGVILGIIPALLAYVLTLKVTSSQRFRGAAAEHDE